MTFHLDKKNQSKCGNIVVWIILIIASILFSAFIVFPQAKKWFELNEMLKVTREQNVNYESEIGRNKSRLANVETEFNRIAKDFLKKELSMFPASLNTNNIAKVLELYSIQYSLIDGNSLFELSSISFSKQESENYTKTTVNMSIRSSKESLKDFIYFIQNNELPVKLLNAQNSLSSILSSYKPATKFLRDNLLPIANIESIKSVSDKKENNDLLNTSIQINLFSQKVKDDQ